MQVHKTSNNISYKGLSTSIFGYKYANLSMKQFASTCQFLGHLLGESPISVEKKIYDSNAQRIQLLKELAKKYNARNAELPIAKRESKEELFQIYESIQTPIPEHFDVLRRSQDGFDKLKKIFSLAQDKKSLDFVITLQRDTLRDERNQSDTIIKLLSSKHKDMYIDNIDQFKSYLKLNSDKEKALDRLDKSIDNKHYNRYKYDSKLAINSLMKFKTVRDYMQPYVDVLAEHYTPEHGRFLWQLTNKFLYNKCDPKSISKKDILELYKTTNADNIQLRLDIINNFKYYTKNNQNTEIKELIKLFRNIEKNEEVRSFVAKSVERGLDVRSIAEFNKIIEKTKLHKANYFFENLRRIVALSEGEERQRAIVRDLENPFFTPLQRRKTGIGRIRENVGDYGIFAKMGVYIQNKIKIFMYNTFEAKKELPLTNKKDTSDRLKFKKLAQERKIQLTKDVNDIIKEKLGKRLYNELEDNFRLKATKVRLSLLSDIFDSIKVTRAQNRKQGITPTVSNKDASRLYELINGKNRKVVRYMLKKCDKDGNRIFDVQQIINLIEKANKDINIIKQSKPDYKAADTKAYYETIYNDFVGRYGKLKPERKNK